MANDLQNKNVSIYIDDTAAVDALETLQKSADGFNKKIEEGRKKQKQLTDEIAAAKNAGKNYGKLERDLKKVNAELDKNGKELEKNTNRQKALQKQIDSGSGPSMRQQQALVNKLEREFKSLGFNTEEAKQKLIEYAKASEQLQAMRKRLHDVKNAQQEATHSSSSFWGSFAGNVAANVLERAASLVEGFFSDAVDEALEAEESTARFHATLDNLGRTDAFDRLTGKADEMAEHFRYLDNDEIVGVYNKLIDYGKLTEKQMNDLLPVIIDFAAKQRISITESTSVVVKALEGSGKALKEYGINIKDADTVSDRLSIVMTTLKEKVEGAGDAFMQTANGGIAQSRQELANVKEEIGTNLIPAIATLLGWFNKVLIGLNYISQKAINTVKDVATFFTDGPAAAAAQKAMREINKQQEIQQKGIQQFIEGLQGQSAEQITAVLVDLQEKLAASQRYLKTAAKGSSEEDIKKRTAAVDQLRKKIDAVLKYQDAMTNTETLGIDSGDDKDDADKKAAAAAKQKADREKAERERLLADLKAFQKKLADMEFERQAAGMSKDEAEIARVRKKYIELLKEAEKFKKVSIQQYNELAAQLKGLEQSEIGTVVKQQLDERMKKEYETSKAYFKAYLDERKAALAEQYANEQITKEQYDQQLLQLDLEYRQNLVINAQDYAKTVKDAEKDLADYTKDLEAFKTQNKIQELEKRKAAEREAAELIQGIYAEAEISRAELAVARSAPDTKKRLDAELNYMKVLKAQSMAELDARHAAERQRILDNAALTEQEKNNLILASTEALENNKAIIEEDFRQQKLQKEIAFYVAMFDMLLTVAQQIADIAAIDNQRKTDQENAELARIQKKNDKEKSSYQKLLNNKLISDQEYNRKAAALDEEYRAKEAEAKKKQWERQQKADIVNAIIKGAQAALSALSAPFPLNIALPILIGIKTAKEINTIKKQPVPEFAKGGYLNGPSHAQGGMPVINPRTGKKEAEVEGGEVILSKKTVKNNADLVDQLLQASLYRDGARITPRFRSRVYKSLDYERVARSTQKVRHFENGGVWDRQVPAPAAVAASEQVAVPVMTPKQEQLLEALLRKLDEPSKAYVVYSEIEAAAEKLQQLDDDAVFK